MCVSARLQAVILRRSDKLPVLCVYASPEDDAATLNFNGKENRRKLAPIVEGAFRVKDVYTAKKRLLCKEKTDRRKTCHVRA